MPPRSLSVLLPDAESHFALPVATCLGSVPGVRVHALSTDPGARVRHSRYCASFEAVGPGEADRARLLGVLYLVDRHRIDVVLPVCETGAGFLDRHRGLLGARAALAPTPRERVLETASDKWLLARFLAQRGFPHPPTLLAGRGADFDAALDELPFPVLLKPRRGSGGRGILRFEDRESLVRHLDRHPDKAGRFVVQSLAPGRDVDASVLCRGGEIVAHTVQSAVTVPDGHAPPTGLEMGERPEVTRLAQCVLAALEWEGVANLDLRQDEEGRVTLVEINARFWSSLLASHAAGVNFPLLACLAALGLEIDSPRPRSGLFFQTRAALEWSMGAVLLGRWSEILRPGETVLPYLAADPLPHALGRWHRPPLPAGELLRADGEEGDAPLAEAA
jgi:predicted ATP-grasp superfamily ATP-dependent carboligase